MVWVLKFNMADQRRRCCDGRIAKNLDLQSGERLHRLLARCHRSPKA